MSFYLYIQQIREYLQRFEAKDLIYESILQ